MTEQTTPADDRTEESVDMVAETSDADPADLVGGAADEDAATMHGETDTIAADADPDAAGHGPNA